MGEIFCLLVSSRLSPKEKVGLFTPIVAGARIGVVTAKAVTGQHTNGDVEEAMQAAQNRYYNFINSTAAKQIIRA